MSSVEVPFFDVCVERDSLLETALPLIRKSVPEWKAAEAAEVKVQQFTSGITNTMFLLSRGDASSVEEKLVLRLDGADTEEIIDRALELQNWKHLMQNGVGPRLMCLFSNGLVMEFLAGTTLSPDDVGEDKTSLAVARMLAKLHTLDIPAYVHDGEKLVQQKTATAHIWPTLSGWTKTIDASAYEALSKRSSMFSLACAEDLQKEVTRVAEHCEQFASPVVFSHNDLLPANIILHEGEVTFIDFEYSAHNPRAFDIANHFCEFAGFDFLKIGECFPAPDFRARWYTAYLAALAIGDDITDEMLALLDSEVMSYCLASHLWWGVWSLYQSTVSKIDFDFLEYSQQRLDAYFNECEQVFASVHGKQ